jgi:Fic family protein
MIDKTRAGILKKNLHGDMAYKSFCPSDLPPTPPIEINDKISDLLIDAHKTLAILDDRGKNIPDMNLFVSIYVQKEALLSSQIEGTQATLEDIFDPSNESNINADVSDVINYVKATNYAIERLKTLPLCNRLLLETHEILLSGVRGTEKNPGEFRNSQNWIGGQGSSLKTARYIPPNVEDMHHGLSELEKYMNLDERYDVLVNAALIHYQFETIHPFLDGNGRIGRLLIVLFLLEKEVLHTPALYLSYYLKENRTEYYDRMTRVRETGDYEQWVRFFLEGIIISAKSALITAEILIEIKENDMLKVLKASFTKRTQETVLSIFEYTLSHPLIDISTTADKLKLSYNTVKKGIDNLEKLGILKQINKHKRNKIYYYENYLNILKEGTENL